jgi:hypothetical protein
MINKITAALIVFSTATLTLTGCQSIPTKLDGVTEGNWRAKALIRDTAQGRSYIVNLNVNVIKDQKTRMDVTTALGTGVASLTADNQEVKYILVDSKRFYFGSPHAEVMKPILAIPFDPRWIGSVLFDEPITEKGWTCTKDDHGLLKECKLPTSDLTVTWSARKGDKKTILIHHTKASVQINVNGFKPKVEDRPGLFSLQAPEGYRKFRVR